MTEKLARKPVAVKAADPVFFGEDGLPPVEDEPALAEEAPAPSPKPARPVRAVRTQRVFKGYRVVGAVKYQNREGELIEATHGAIVNDLTEEDTHSFLAFDSIRPVWE